MRWKERHAVGRLLIGMILMAIIVWFAMPTVMSSNTRAPGVMTIPLPL